MRMCTVAAECVHKWFQPHTGFVDVPWKTLLLMKISVFTSHRKITLLVEQRIRSVKTKRKLQGLIGRGRDRII